MWPRRTAFLAAGGAVAGDADAASDAGDAAAGAGVAAGAGGAAGEVRGEAASEAVLAELPVGVGGDAVRPVRRVGLGQAVRSSPG